ncbi:DNA polymerase Y family protein [Desulfomarina sp.]
MGAAFVLPERSVLHLNVADFAVSVERVVDCTLRGRPLIIAPLQGARTVVYDMSEEAYGDGVRKGMGLRHAMKRCRRALLLPPRPRLYRKAMTAFLKEVRSYSPLVESGGIDGHFFVDVTGTHRLHGPPPDVGLRLRHYARDRLGINPIWSLGSSRLVAKVASRLVKPVGEYIVAPGEEADFLAPLPVDLLPGLTGVELRKIKELQLLTVGCLAGLTREQLMVVFADRSDHLYHISRGIDTTVIGMKVTRDAVSYEHVFANDTNNRHDVERAISHLVDRAGYRLRAGRQVAGRVAVRLRYSDGRQLLRRACLRRGSNSDFVLHSQAIIALQRAWRRRTRIRSCLLICDRLRKQSPQLPLFPGGEYCRRRELLAAMDTIRTRFGEEAVRRGGMKSSCGGG